MHGICITATGYSACTDEEGSPKNSHRSKIVRRYSAKFSVLVEAWLWASYSES